MLENAVSSLGSRWAVAGQSPGNRRELFSDYFRLFSEYFFYFPIIFDYFPVVVEPEALDIGGDRNWRPRKAE